MYCDTCVLPHHYHMATNPSCRPAWEDAGVRCRCPSHCWWCVGTQLLRWLERPRGLAGADAIWRQLRQCQTAFRRMETWVDVHILFHAMYTLNVMWSVSSQVYRLKKWGVSFRSQEEIQGEEIHSQCRNDAVTSVNEILYYNDTI